MELFRLFGSVFLRDEATPALEQVESNAESMGKKLGKLGEGFEKAGKKMSLFVTTPIVGAVTMFAKSAMDLEATGAKYDTVFEGMTDRADAFLNQFKQLTPATMAEAKSMASGLQDLLVPMGFARDEATELTGSMMHAVGALTNFNSGTHDAQRVTEAMQSALLGQYQSLASLGIQLDVNTVKQKAVEMGLASSTDEVTKQHQALVMIQEVYNQSGDALGAYNEESLDAKTKMALLKSDFIDLAASIGENLLPIINDVVTFLRDLTARFAELSPEQQKTLLVIMGLVAAIGPLILIIGKIMSIVSTAIVIFGKLGLVFKTVGVVIAFLTSPIGLIILAIGALIAIGVLLYKNWDEVSAFLSKSWEWIKEKAVAIFDWLVDFFKEWGTLILAIITGPVGIVVYLVHKYWDEIKDFTKRIWDWISNKTKEIFNGIVEFFKKWGPTILTVVSGPIGWVVALIYKNWDAIKEATSNAWTWIKDKISGLWDSIKNIFVKAKDTFHNIGKDIITGLWNGINSVGDWIRNKVSGFVKGIGSTIKNFFGIASPSKLTTEYGQEISKGLGIGMEDGKFNILSIVGDIGKGITTKVEETTKVVKKESKEMAQSMAKEVSAVKDTLGDLVRELDKIGDAVITALKNKYSEEERLKLDSLRRMTDRIRTETDIRLKQYDREFQGKIKLLDEETQLEIRARQKQIDAINAETLAEEEALKEQEYQKRLAEKYLQLHEAKDEKDKVKIVEEINEMIAKKERENLLKTRQDQIESLREEMDTVREQAEEKRKELEQELKVKKSHEQAKLDMNLEFMKSEETNVRDHYKNLNDGYNLQAEARRLAVESDNSELVNLLQDYNPQWQNAGQSFGDSLINGLKSKQEAIKNVIDSTLNLMGRVSDGKSGIVVNEFTPAVENYPGLKDGGDITRGGRVLVGEKAPEILDLPRGARVTPLNKESSEVKHKHEGMIKVQGINDKGQLVDTIELVVNDIIVDILRKEARFA